MQEQVFLTYINSVECNSYSITGTINGSFVDIDASQRFIHIPLLIDPQGYTNEIDLKVNYTYQNNSFQAVPAMLWQYPVINKSLNLTRHRYIISQPSQKDFFPNQHIPWLGSESNIKTKLKLAKVLDIDRTNFIVNDKNTLLRLRVAMNFSYIQDSWMLCYKFHPSKIGDRYYWQGHSHHVGVRIDKNLQFSHIQANSRYNYVQIGDKSIALHKIINFEKIRSIWDYLRCLKTCETILNVNETFR